jgi:hypothetical protein
LAVMTQTTGRFQHPEAQAGELWLGNVYACDFPAIGWTTKRLGREPFDSRGVPLRGGTMRPVLVQRSEIEAAGVAIPAIGAIDHRW